VDEVALIRDTISHYAPVLIAPLSIRIRPAGFQKIWSPRQGSIPLAWCGMWVGGWLGLAIVPLFATACVVAYRRSKPLLLLYATPALVMLGLHAALASFYTRYNLALIGPFSAAAAWLIASIITRVRPQSRVPALAR
jgi:hypothetical protein